MPTGKDREREKQMNKKEKNNPKKNEKVKQTERKSSRRKKKKKQWKGDDRTEQTVSSKQNSLTGRDRKRTKSCEGWEKRKTEKDCGEGVKETTSEEQLKTIRKKQEKQKKIVQKSNKIT